MTPSLLCLAAMLCLTPASGLPLGGQPPDQPNPLVSLWQGVPVPGRERREAQDHSIDRVSTRDDSMVSSVSTSLEEWDDIFEVWRKKRDAKRSPGGTSSTDMDIFENWTDKRDAKRSPGGASSTDIDDIFENWTDKRDSKRSPGSTNPEDEGDMFGVRGLGQSWSWEDGDSGSDVYGDWSDKRQAETELQHQKH